MPLSDLQIVAVCYALAINLTAFLAFAWDKYCARNKLWRVSEQTLLALAFFGGTFGALAGKWAVRHKTRKRPFVTYLRFVISVQAILLAALSFPQGRHALWSAIQIILG